jgi:integrase
MNEEPKDNYRRALEQSAGPALAKDPGIKLVSNRTTQGRQERQKRRKYIQGLGSIYHPDWTDAKTGELKMSPVCWIQYQVKGKTKRESAHSKKESDALKLLKKRHAEIAAGKPLGPDVERTTLSDLAVMILDDYTANKRTSIGRVEDAIVHLKDYFGGAEKVINITGDRITAYITTRQKEKAANSTINIELSALSRMFVLGIRAGKVATKPYIGKLKVNNTRKGFFEWEQFHPVLSCLSEDLQAPIEVAYITGWRIHDEIFTRQKHHADPKGRGWLRLEPGETKNDEGRMFPMTVRLRTIIEKQLEKTKSLEKATGRIIPWLFHRDGKPIKSFRRAWRRACKDAGVPGKIPHDFRRTAVRNLERAGVPRSAAMKMVGHRTEAIYRRYAIADEKMLGEAADKLEILQATDQQESSSKVSAK